MKGAADAMLVPGFTLPESIEAARAIQETLRTRVRLFNDFTTLEHVAGIDVGYDNTKGLARASIVVMPLSTLKVVERAQACVPVDFPYIPGLLSFREIPAIFAALATLSQAPQLLMVDGQGIAHPRRLGIAAHTGVIMDMPSIGVAKSRLTGRFQMPGPMKGDTSPLMFGKERIGTVLRSRDHVKPLFISPGHRIDVETSLAVTLQCLRRYRLPEPTRMADKYSKTC